MVSILTPIVDATNRPSFYGGYYDVPPLTLGLSSYFGFSPSPLPNVGWHVPTLWGWGSPMSRFGDEWYGYDLFDAGARLLGWGNALTETDPFLHPYVWNNLMLRNYYPYGLPFPWNPPPVPYNTWPVQQSYGGQAPMSLPSSHVTMNGTGVPPPPRTDGEPPPTEDHLEPPPSGNGTPPPPPSGRSGRRNSGRAAQPSQLSAMSLMGPINLGDQVKTALVNRIGEGNIFDTSPGDTEYLFVKSSGQAYVFKVTRQGIQISDQPIGTVRDGKLYPNQ